MDNGLKFRGDDLFVHVRFFIQPIYCTSEESLACWSLRAFKSAVFFGFWGGWRINFFRTQVQNQLIDWSHTRLEKNYAAWGNFPVASKGKTVAKQAMEGNSNFVNWSIKNLDSSLCPHLPFTLRGFTLLSNPWDIFRSKFYIHSGLKAI